MPAIHPRKFREFYESCRHTARTTGGGEQNTGQVFRNRMMTELLGVVEDPRTGRKRIVNPRFRPEDFKIHEMASAIMGDDNRHKLMPKERLVERDRVYMLHEAGGAAVGPSQFIDINSWDVSVGGLIEAKLIEAYSLPKYIMDRIFRNVPTNLHAEKLIQTGRIGDKSETMQPGQTHPRAQFTERFITTPYTLRYGLAIDVTKEAAFFDRTNTVLSKAETVGLELGLRKEYLQTDVFIGSTQNPYVYGGTGYNTYLTSGNWINDVASNALADINNVNTAWFNFSRMTDQESGQPVDITPDMLVVTPQQVFTARNIIHATELEILTSGSSSIYNAGTRTFAPNAEDPLSGRAMGAYELLWSNYLYKRLTDVSGANLSANAANSYWWLLEAQKAFAWMENWPMTTISVGAGDYVTADNGLILSTFADFMGVGMVLEPRAVVRSHT